MNSVIDAPTFEALKAAMGEDFIGELIDTYCTETPFLLVQLQQALAQGDVDSFRRSAHSIKSSSASFGAQEFSAQARELEMLGKAGDLASAGEKLDGLVSAYEKVELALRELQNGS